ERIRLLERVTVLDSQENVADIAAAIEAELAYVVTHKFRTALVSRLEGWWIKQCGAHLKDRSAILGYELTSVIDDIRDQLTDDSLPIDDVDDLLAELNGAESYFERVFVHQLEFINFSRPRLALAIADWMKAYVQRSRWVREQLVTTRDLEKYE